MMSCGLGKIFIYCLALILAVGASMASAQHLVGMQDREIDDFRIPEFDSAGVLKSEIFGKKARILENNKIKITGLQIIMYKKRTDTSVSNQVDAVLSSDHCTVDQKSKDAFSNADMRIVRDNVVITGRGFRWSAGSQRIEILNDFHMVMMGRVKVWPLLKEKK